LLSSPHSNLLRKVRKKVTDGNSTRLTVWLANEISMTESLLMAAVSESNDNKNCSSRLLTFIFILLRSLIINGRVVKLCGAIGVITKQLLSGVIMGPPQLKLYPVLPVGVDIMIPSAQ